MLQEQQKEFNLKQTALTEAAVSMTEEDMLSKETQIQKYVQNCRSSSNKKPVDGLEEVDQMVEM